MDASIDDMWVRYLSVVRAFLPLDADSPMMGHYA